MMHILSFWFQHHFLYTARNPYATTLPYLNVAVTLLENGVKGFKYLK
ncbi:hypothetical protein IIA28_12010 [candidate division KSB1 bacterium]|nr:hypothetical protein [candidate division KSB1 bacterium]